MVLHKFYINVFVRVIFILLTCILLGVVLQNLSHGYYYTLTGIILLIALQTWLLVNQVNKTNTDLEKFFSSARNNDSSIRFPEFAESGSFRKLHDRMNDLNLIIQKTKIENEKISQFLQTVVDHVDIGLLSFDADGRIEIYNSAAKRYLKIQQPGLLSVFEATDDKLYKILNTIKPGQEILHKIIINNHLQSILIKAAEMKSEGRTIRLVSLQDITNELDKKELDSWQRLIRVLTHEIMNSISPITSLTSVISGYFNAAGTHEHSALKDIDNVIITKTLAGLNTIEETGKGLLGFVEKYRSLTSLPKPEMCRFTVDGLFSKCKLLMESGIGENIRIITSVSPEDLAIEADFAQVEHVLINLVKNGAEALSGDQSGIIQLKAFYADNSVIIHVEDNGPGISPGIIEDIFVPFYTTRKSGSGIGLSLSKQIMQNHGGSITVNSSPGAGSVFILRFPEMP
jgi:two-component system, NtrC family, nitrogen regulation sensor histidine kinase NtrY